MPYPLILSKKSKTLNKKNANAIKNNLTKARDTSVDTKKKDKPIIKNEMTNAKMADVVSFGLLTLFPTAAYKLSFGFMKSISADHNKWPKYTKAKVKNNKPYCTKAILQ